MKWAIAQWMHKSDALPLGQTWPSLTDLTQALRLFPSPQSLIDDWRTAIAASVETWFRDHPILAWGVDHPIAGLILTLITFLFLLSFFQLIIDVTRQLWLIILQLPLQILRWLVNQLTMLMKLGLKKVRRMLPSSLLGTELESRFTRASLHPSEPPTERSRLEELPLPKDLPLPPPSPSSADQEIAQLLYRLEHLTQEQTQILHQIARLTEAKS